MEEKWDVRKLVAEMHARKREEAGQFRPDTIPPMSPTFWRTMDEDIFRDLMKSNLNMLTSMESLKAIRERCKQLGIAAP